MKSGRKASILPPMERHRTFIRVCAWCVSIAGSCLVAEAFSRLNVGLPVQMLLLILWLAVLTAALLAVNTLWFRQLAKAVDALGPLQVSDPDRYIDGINALLEHQNSRQLQSLRFINLSAAYTAKQDYQTAKTLLEQVPVEHLAPALRGVYWADLAMNLFLLGEMDAALAIMDAQKPLFDASRDNAQLAQVLSLLDIFQSVARNDTETARKLLEQSRQRWTDSSSAAYYGKIEKLLSRPPEQSS